MRKLTFFCLFVSVFCFGQNNWPKSFGSPTVTNYSIIEDNDGGYLATITLYGDIYSYLLKFDANANLIWRKCLFFKVFPYVTVNHFYKDEYKNSYIIGSMWDSFDPKNRVGFSLKLDSCYNKTNAVLYSDTTYGDQQYFLWNGNISDSLFYISGWGFSSAFNQVFIINKSNLLPKKVYNTPANLYGNNECKKNNFTYIPFDDYFYLKGGDTTSGALRTSILKLDKNGDEVFYKFFGFDENLLSNGVNIFKNRKDNLFVFSIFREIVNDTSNLEYSPILFECDTNGKMLNFKIYRDDSINQIFSTALQFNDSTYIMATTYLNKGVSNRSIIEKIKLYKLDEKGNVKDSFYVNNWGKKLFTSGQLNLIKTFDNKIMLAFSQRDSDFNNYRLTFIKFDENFKLDTTEYRNKSYDTGCMVSNDSINLSNAPFFYLNTDSGYPLLHLSKPLGIIIVPEEYKTAFYPNPIKTEATFEFEIPQEGEIEIVLTNSSGGILRDMYTNTRTRVGKNEIKLNFENISSGQYYLSLYFNKQVKHVIKVVKE